MKQEVQVEAPPKKKLSRKDFDSGLDVRWCPGCGDYSILANMQRFLPTLGVPRENIVFISGIGCSSRFPYYMNTFGFHTIHGRAPAFATGLKVACPELSVWVVTGDGDGLSIGGNHLMHIIRRNVDVNILLFNNRIYGLTKGQYSPTSERGTVTKSTPMGSVEGPLSPLSLALGCQSSFVARCVDTDAKQMQAVFQAAEQHRGTSLIEILQNCPVFNDDTFADVTDKKKKLEAQLLLEVGKPMLFGKDKQRGLMFENGRFKVAVIGQDGVSIDDIMVHKPGEMDPSVAFALSHLDVPDFPVPMGVLRQVERPTYDSAVNAQVQGAQNKSPADLQALLQGPDSWIVD